MDDDRWAAGGWAHGTNNMGELMAVLDLLEQTVDAGDSLTILCDSQYVINSLTTWLPGWKRKGWRKADGKPVLNVELLQALDKALHRRQVTFEWVKGHAGHALNEAADARARAAATAYRDGTPLDRGPGFRPGPPKPPGRSFAPTPVEAPSLLDEPAAADHPVVALQRSLLSEEVRSSPERLDALLHPNVVLTDASGKSAGKGRTIAGAPASDLRDAELEVLSVDELAPWVVLLRWRLRTPSAVTAASSVWIKKGDSWRLRAEQHTPIGR